MKKTGKAGKNVLMSSGDFSLPLLPGAIWCTSCPRGVCVCDFLPRLSRPAPRAQFRETWSLPDTALPHVHLKNAVRNFVFFFLSFSFAFWLFHRVPSNFFRQLGAKKRDFTQRHPIHTQTIKGKAWAAPKLAGNHNFTSCVRLMDLETLFRCFQPNFHCENNANLSPL